MSRNEAEMRGFFRNEAEMRDWDRGGSEGMGWDLGALYIGRKKRLDKWGFVCHNGVTMKGRAGQNPAGPETKKYLTDFKKCGIVVSHSSEKGEKVVNV